VELGLSSMSKPFNIFKLDPMRAFAKFFFTKNAVDAFSTHCSSNVSLT